MRHWRTRVESPNLTIRPEVVIKSCERIDDLQCKGYQIIQNSGMFCFGMDAVLLANYVRFSAVADIWISEREQVSYLYFLLQRSMGMKLLPEMRDLLV